MILQSLISGPLFSQEVSQADKVVRQNISRFTEHVSPQKVYLHINKGNFSAGDVIWLKVYLMDGVMHTPDTARSNIYVELVNSLGVLMERRILLAENGTAEGDINISREMPDGNYMLRAYTDWMRNSGDEFYFTRYLYISNQGYADIIPRSEVRVNRRFNRDIERMADQYTISFFPEGGLMVAGVPGRVAFKATDMLGRGLAAEGEVVNGRSEVVARFSTRHAGTGSFEFTPEAGMTYTARVSFNGSSSGNFSLPGIEQTGTALRVDQDDDNILISIVSTHVPGERNYTEEVTLVTHTRGKVINGASVSLQDGRASHKIAKAGIPSGVSHLTVFSGELIPLAERLFFVHHDDAFVFYPSVNRQKVGDREYYVLSLDVTDRSGDPVEGKFSLSVVTGETVMPPVIHGNILTELLLASDLPGIIEEPYRYFDQETDMSAALDDLMMTNGWRRFTWDHLLSGRLTEINYPSSSSLSVSGRVLDPSDDRGLSNFPVSLDITGEDNGNYTSSTNVNGVFVFDDLIFHDNVRIRVSSDRLINNHPPKFVLQTGEISGIAYQPNIFTRPHQITDRGGDWRRVAGAGSSQYAQTDDGPAAQQYGVPDQTVYIDRESNLRNMYDILVTRVRGLNHNLQFRGPTSITLASTPLFLLDGVETSQGAFLNLDPRYIERLEIFSGPRASMFGVRGASGAILGYTRRAGDPGMTGYEEYLIQGYHSPREYYTDIVSFAPVGNNESDPVRSVYWEPNLVTDNNGNVTTAVPVMRGGGVMGFIIEGTGTEKGVGFGMFTIRSSPE